MSPTLGHAAAGIAMLCAAAGAGSDYPGGPSLHFKPLPKARRCCKCGKVVSGRRYCACGHRVDPPKGKTPCCPEIGQGDPENVRWLLRVNFDGGNIDLTPAGPYVLDEMELARRTVLESAPNCYLVEFDREPDLEATVEEMGRLRDYLTSEKRPPGGEEPSLLRLPGALGMVVRQEDMPR